MNTHPQTGAPESAAGDPVANAVLPRWRCHKEVVADKIVDIRTLPPRVAEEEEANPKDTRIRWQLACGWIVIVSSDLIARGSPNVGDYFVQYLDGYKSWSPAKAFEEGYTRV